MTPQPPPPARTERRQRPLAERIALAEQRLVMREQTLRQGVQRLLHRTEAAMAPRRLVVPVVGTLGALALAWFLVTRLGQRRHAGAAVVQGGSAPSAAAARSRGGAFDGVRWERAVPLLWPLLPVAWRGRVGPGATSVFVTVALPLAAGLFGRRLRRR
jgi:hypothetical protein